ncbi:ABC transporter permease [Pseudonocardia sp. KRD-184]|uniref:ABC transporter permease n=1 Tax=Pseudonocardia oceani TaxID=2792013 RepID=A0ABS6UA76_9PSEU|nr:ABC transporter permease [Pseudonocardia oceani]MBW0090893.1 ABC transporter permease [Pseudonocardia oceani]MBW0098395.1 ABC transporter permease [Pseudonocardia oceani]MBW0110614.1 ABC transporter permease [Pseudonocardia oceani]MBW0122366.1 ABC transporter permease [Pseudonocardia oceani]MBW0129143.1 ABC transporter permease [Pseudonocardia oceani]
MTTATTGSTGATAAAGPASRVLALATAEVRLLLRNRTAAISSLFLPIAFGVFFAFTFEAGVAAGPGVWATIVALQLVVTFTMGVYVTITQTVVARRQTRVLKRMRTSSLSDAGLLVATTGPAVAIAVVHLVLYAVIDTVLGAPFPADVVPLVLAVLGGLAVCVTAGFATTIVTPTPERAQITTLPLFFLMFGAAFVVPVLPVDSWWQALVLVPGAPIGLLTQLAFTGGAWAPGLPGLPAALPGIVSLVGWTAAFTVLSQRRFRWDPRV